MNIALVFSSLLFLGLLVTSEAKLKQIRSSGYSSLSCSYYEGRIKIISVTEIFQSKTSYCETHYCYWNPGRFRPSPPCAVDKTLLADLSYHCDGDYSCNLESRITNAKRCCYEFYSSYSETCLKRNGYNIKFDCHTDVQTLKLRFQPKPVNVHGNQLVIKSPEGGNGVCECHVYTIDVNGYTYNYLDYKYMYCSGSRGCEPEEIKRGVYSFNLYSNTNSLVYLDTFNAYYRDVLNVNCSCIRYEIISTRPTTLTSRPTSENTRSSRLTTVGPSSKATLSFFASTIPTTPSITTTRTAPPTTSPSTRTRSTTSATSTSTSPLGMKRNKVTPATDKETGDNTVIIGGAIGGALLLIAGVVIVLIFTKRRRNNRPSVPDQKNNYSVAYHSTGDPNDSSNISIHNPHTILDDDGYNHLPDPRNDNSNLDLNLNVYNHIGNAGTGDDNYNHFGANESCAINENTYDHAEEEVDCKLHDDDNYNHIGGRNSNINFTNDDYNHISGSNSNDNFTDGDYNHIRGSNSTDTGVNNIGGIDYADYNHICDDKKITNNQYNPMKVDNFRTTAVIYAVAVKPEEAKEPSLTRTHDVNSERKDDSADIYVNQELATDGEYANIETDASYLTSSDNGVTSGFIEAGENDHRSHSVTAEYALSGAVQKLYDNV